MKKLSNKGQSLVLFVMLLPIIVFVFIYVINIYYMSYFKNKINSINYNAVNYVINNLDNNVKEKLEKILNENDIKKDEYDIVIDLNNNYVQLEINKENKIFYNNIIKLNNFKVKSIYKATKIDENNKAVIERVE